MTGENITISAAEYRELLALKEGLNKPQIVAELPSRARLDNDAQVASFLSERFGKMHMDCLLEECRKRFGEARSPSKSAAYRYWQKLRDKRSKSG